MVTSTSTNRPSAIRYQPVPRNEDPILLRGQGRYTDDPNLPGQAYAVMVAVVTRSVIDGIEIRKPGRAADT
jgi:CO/xanthine dehydrogenase Mo-binding subunit